MKHCPHTLLCLLCYLCCSALAQGQQNSLKPFGTRGFALKGQTSMFCSLVKSKDFPIGQQYVATYGGGVGYYAARMSYFAFFNRRQTIYSVPHGLLLYRGYNGYECGANVRRTLGEAKRLCVPFGIGMLLSGSYDTYTGVKQHMAYASVGSEVFLSFNLHKRQRNIFPVEVSIPIIYAFRQSGHYFNVGISLQAGLCTPRKH
jgi:hypothetical protein